MGTSIEWKTMKKVYLRLLPFCFVLYFICYLDRVNIGFASLTMNKDLGLSSYVFGLGAGAFFWGYFILEVPSNLILDRVGARRWIAYHGDLGPGFRRVCVHQRTGQLFHPAFSPRPCRSGFLPRHDPIFHLLVPPSHRARIVAGFMAAIPVSIGLGAPIRHPSSSSMASSASPGGDGCSSARRLPR